MKDVQCAETNEKSYFRFFWFYFSSYCENSSEIDIFEYKNDHIQKLKVAKIWKLIFHSFQHVTHLLCKSGHFWKKTYFLFGSMWPLACKTLKRSLRNMPLKLASETGDLNSKARGPGVQPGGGCEKINLADWINSWTKFYFSKVVKFTWKMRNLLKRMKNQFSDFCYF